MKIRLKACAIIVFVSCVTGCDHDGAGSESSADGPSAQPQAGPAAPPAGDSAAAKTPEAEARRMLDEVNAQIGEQRWSDAEATLQKLDGLKPSLNEKLRVEIDNAKGHLRNSLTIMGR
jgi:hypothetical protein